MAFELITGGLISAIFVIVLVVTSEFVLWKLRKNGKAYKMLSNLAIAAGILFLVLFVWLVI